MSPTSLAEDYKKAAEELTKIIGKFPREEGENYHAQGGNKGNLVVNVGKFAIRMVEMPDCCGVMIIHNFPFDHILEDTGLSLVKIKRARELAVYMATIKVKMDLRAMAIASISANEQGGMHDAFKKNGWTLICNQKSPYSGNQLKVYKVTLVGPDAPI